MVKGTGEAHYVGAYDAQVIQIGERHRIDAPLPTTVVDGGVVGRAETRLIDSGIRSVNAGGLMGGTTMVGGTALAGGGGGFIGGGGLGGAAGTSFVSGRGVTGGSTMVAGAGGVARGGAMMVGGGGGAAMVGGGRSMVGGGDLFSKLDTNNDGVISRAEFNQAVGGGMSSGPLNTVYGSLR